MDRIMHRGDWLALGGSIAIAIATLLPWATVGPISIEQTSAESGRVMLVLGVAAALLTVTGSLPAAGSRSSQQAPLAA